MYLKFYQLHKKPFSLAPDPEFLYLSQQHKDALGAIIYGIKERAGFVCVVGEVGTGKTTIVRSYLQKTGRDRILPIFIFNSRINFTELMKNFLVEIGISSEMVKRAQSLNDMVRLAYRAMIERTRKGKTIVLIIDEAQNMPIETLAKLCVLSNFETAKAKLIQIVLVGQPELKKKLDLYELRQLRQRIAYRALITPLTPKDCADYMKHRLSLSSKGDKPLFTQGAIRTIIKHSKGVPRVINVLSENSLVAGYGLQKKPVTKTIVKQVIAEYEGNHLFGRIILKNATSSLLALLIAGTLLVSWFLHKDPSQGATNIQQVLPLSPTETGLTGVANYSKVDERLPAHQIRQVDKNNTDQISDKPASIDLLDLSERLRTWDSFTLIRTFVAAKGHIADQRESFKGEKAASLSDTMDRQVNHLKIAKKGDTVSRLCLSTYGFVNSQVLQWVKSYNPHIYNLDEIQVGDIILFPSTEQPNVLQTPERTNNKSSSSREEIVRR